MFLLRSLSGAQFSAAFGDYGMAAQYNWHAHQEPIVTLLVSGEVEEAVSRRDRTVGMLEVGFKPPGIRHADRFGPRGVRALRVALGPELLAAVERIACDVLEWGWIARSPAVVPLMRLARQLCQTEPSEIALLDDLHEALGALAGRGGPAKRVSRNARWLDRVREEIDDDRGNGVRLGKLADHAGVHPVYLARQFRACYGCSVGEYIHWRKALTATELLGDIRQSIADAALAVGCSDQPHFTRMLRRTTGLTPAALRRLLTLERTE